MIGDFDDSANALWTLYGKEAKSQDEARIQALKDDMDGVLIFVRLYSVCAIARLGIAVGRFYRIGRIVFRYSHFFFNRHYTKFASGPYRQSGVLLGTKRRAAQPDFPSAGFHRPTSRHPF